MNTEMIADEKKLNLAWFPKGAHHVVDAHHEPESPMIRVRFERDGKPSESFVPATGLHLVAENFCDVVVIGSFPGDEVASTNKNVCPDGTQKLWFASVRKEPGNVFHVGIAYYTKDPADIRTVLIRLGQTDNAFAEKYMLKTEDLLRDPATLEKFLQDRETLAEMVRSENVIYFKRLPATMALACLERNRHNRPIDKRHVNMLRTEMANTKYTRSSDNICFDVNGNLIDGQHRCAACLLSHGYMPTAIATGHEERDIRNMNSNAKRRTQADNYNIIRTKQKVQGFVEAGDTDFRDLPNGKFVRRIARGITLIEMEGQGLRDSTVILQDILDTYHSSLMLMEAEGYVEALLPAKSRSPERANLKLDLLANDAVIAVFVLAYRNFPKMVERALRRVLTNDALGKDTALWTLERILDSAASKKTREEQLALARKVFICLHFYRENEYQEDASGNPIAERTNADPTTPQQVEKVASMKLKNDRINYESYVGPFKTKLPDSHPDRIEHKVDRSFLNASWRSDAAALKKEEEAGEPKRVSRFRKEPRPRKRKKAKAAAETANDES